MFKVEGNDVKLLVCITILINIQNTMFVSDILNTKSVYCGSDTRPRLFIVTFSVFAVRTQSLLNTLTSVLQISLQRAE